MKPLCIFGAGGFAHEAYWLAKQASRTVEAFIDTQVGTPYDDIEVKTEDYFSHRNHQAIVAIGSCHIRELVSQRIMIRHGRHSFTTLISPAANMMSDSVRLGDGSIICANCILTCQIKIGFGAQLNLSTTIGHDCLIGDYFTTAPGVHISGKCYIGNCVYFGTGSSVIEGTTICDNVIIGAGAVVVKNITEPGTYVGVPAKRIQ